MNGEDRGQLTDARFYPAPAVVKIAAAGRIVPAQKGAAHAAVDDVVPGRVGQRDEGGAGAGHGQEFKECCLFRQLKWVSFLFLGTDKSRPKPGLEVNQKTQKRLMRFFHHHSLKNAVYLGN